MDWIFVLNHCFLIICGVCMQHGENVSDVLKSIIEAGSEIQYSTFEVVLVDQKNTRGEIYKSFSLPVSGSPAEVCTFLKPAIEYLLDKFASLELVDYDCTVWSDSSIAYRRKSGIGLEAEEILESLKNKIAINDSVLLSTISFMLVHIEFQGHQLYMFEPFIDPFKVYRNKKRICAFHLNGNKLKEIDHLEDVIIISNVVDVLFLDDWCYILDDKKFKKYFNCKQHYYDTIEANYNQMTASGLFDSKCLERFVEDCKANGRILPRLAKALQQKLFSEVALHSEKIPLIIESRKLDLEFKDGKFAYRDKKELNCILNFLLDHYVTTDVTGSPAIAKAIQKDRCDES